MIASPQGTHVADADGRAVLNLCANNYLGLADDPRVVAAARDGARPLGLRHGLGRFICGTQTIHRALEQRLARVPRHRGRRPVRLVLRRERRGLRGAARRAGRGHLRRAQPRDHHRRHPAVQGAAAALRQPGHGRARAAAARRLRMRGTAWSSPTACSRWTATSPRWTPSAPSPTATTRSSWSTTRTRSASSGPTGRGTPELFGVADRVDIVTGTLGKALGGRPAATSRARREIVELLKQRARPYLFSNSVAAADRGRVACACSTCWRARRDLRDQGARNAARSGPA